MTGSGGHAREESVVAEGRTLTIEEVATADGITRVFESTQRTNSKGAQPVEVPLDKMLRTSPRELLRDQACRLEKFIQVVRQIDSFGSRS